MTDALKKYATRIVGLLVIIEAISGYFLWTISPINEAGEEIFAIFLAIDLVSLAMMSNVYLAYEHNSQLNRALLLSGCAFILVPVYVSLAI